VPADESELSFDQPRSMFSTWVGVVLLFAAFGLFVWVVMGAMPRGDSYEEKRAKTRLEKLKTSAEESKAPNAYGWLDKEKGVVRMPMGRAMELSVAELAQKKPAPANPIAPAAPDEGAGPQAGAPTGPAPVAAAVSPAGPAATPKATTVKGAESEIRGQPAAAANPPAAPPGTQPGPAATPGATPLAGAAQPRPGVGQPSATPVQTAPGTPLPVRGKKP